MRFYHLAKKWAKDCTTIESLLALVSWDAIYKLMLRQMANAVKDKKPHIFEEALEMADDFTTTRGWSYKLLKDAGQHSSREDKHRRHQGRQDTQDNMETLPKLLRPKETGKSSNHGDTTWKTAPSSTQMVDQGVLSAICSVTLRSSAITPRKAMTRKNYQQPIWQRDL